MKEYKCILLVDDDPIDNFIHYTILHELKLSTCICMCRNGKEALIFLEEYKAKNNCLPELILIDAMMPIMDGLEFIEEYEKQYGLRDSETILFLLSNLFKAEEIDILNKNGVLYYLEKPLDKTKLIKILQNNSALQIAS